MVIRSHQFMIRHSDLRALREFLEDDIRRALGKQPGSNDKRHAVVVLYFNEVDGDQVFFDGCSYAEAKAGLGRVCMQMNENGHDPTVVS